MDGDTHTAAAFKTANGASRHSAGLYASPRRQLKIGAPPVHHNGGSTTINNY
jgi:hypothetical protein